MARLSGGDEVEGLDEEFLYHLNRGSDLLARGDAATARTSLERALLLRPKDAKVLGLLGQACYKLARYDDATIAWQRLVDDNPVEPAARVNLGLAFLKAKRYPEATKQLEIALDLNPDHKKAMGYLGLVLLEAGSAEKAREWFLRAGSDQMVSRCDEVLAGGGSARAPRPTDEDAGAGAGAGAGAEPADTPPPAPEPLGTPMPGTYAAVELGAAASAGPAAPTSGADVLAAWAATRLVRPAFPGTFSVQAGVLAAEVHGELRIRLDGLIGTRGRIAVTPELKRFRGRPTEKPFGEGAARMHHVRGEGALLFRAEGRRFTALDLGADAVYLRDEVLFGFEEGIAFENGRVPSSSGAELDLVHLRGRGRFLLATAGEPVAVDASSDAPVRVPLRALVGWVGALTPRMTALLEEGGEASAGAVELTGDGRVLVDPGVPGGAAA